MTKYVWCSNNEKYYRSRKNKHNDSILSFAQSCIDKNIYSYDKLEYEPNENGEWRYNATKRRIKGAGYIDIDTTLNVEPSAAELATIAKMTAKVVEMFGIKPVLAMLSFSNFGSSDSEEAEKISSAIKLLHKNNPDIIVDGPIQSDFALNKKC